MIDTFTKICAKNVPGVVKVLLTEVGNIDTITVTDGEVSAVTMNSVYLFHEAQCEIDSVELKQTGKGKMTYSIEQSLEMGFSKLSKDLLTFKQSVVDAVPCGLCAIVKDGNGNWFLAGWNDTDKDGRPLNQIEDNFTSGKKPDDEAGNMFTITLKGLSGYDVLPFDSTLSTALSNETSAATAFCEFV